MLKLSVPLSGLVMLYTSLSAFAAPAPLQSLAGQTFIVKGEAFQSKLAITADGLGKIWRPDGYSTLHWILQGENLVATLDTPLETPNTAFDAEGNPVQGVMRLETLTFAFADGQKIVADVKESYREVYPAESGVPETVTEFDNPALPFINHDTLKPFRPTAGSLLGLPLSGEQSAIIKVTDATQAVLVEDPLNKAPANFSLSISDTLTLSLSPSSTIRYSIVEDEGLASVLLGEIKEDGKESILLSAGGVVDQSVYETPASATEFAGTYTIPEFADTQYVFSPDGIGRIITQAPDGTVLEGLLTWGEQAGLIFGHRWVQGAEGNPVVDAAVAKACEAGTAEDCTVAQSRTYKILARTATQLLVLRVLDQKVEDGVSTWIHVFNLAK